MIEMIVLGVVAIVFGVLILVAFWLGYKAGIRDVPELPSQRIPIEDVGISEESEYDGISETDYLKEENVFLYAGFEKSENLRDWEDIHIKKLNPELYPSAKSDAVLHLVPLSTLENGYYIFTLGHGPKWLFKIA